MNKKAFRSASRYSLVVTLIVMVLIISAVIASVPKHATNKTQILNTNSASGLTVQSPTISNAPEVSNSGSGNASSSGATSLQPATLSPGTGSVGVAYPCDSCPAASEATDIMVCTDYCISPTPAPSPYPACDPCHGNTYGTSGSAIMCPLIACRMY